MQRVVSAMMVCALFLSVLAGCDSSTADLPELVPVTGVVTLDGAPAAGVNVTFIPVGSTAGGASYGATDAGGKYELKSNDGRLGAAVGEFKVVCSKWIMPDGSDYVGVPGGPSPMEAGAKEKLSPKFSDENATTLKATVPAGGGTINFDLTEK